MEINVEDFHINDVTEQEDLNKAVFETVVTGGDIEKNYSVEYGITTGTQVAFIGAMDDVGSAKSGCGGEEEDAVIKFTDKKWEVNKVGFLLSYCEDELPQMLKILKRKIHESPERYNVIEDDVEKLITAQIELAVKKLINRMAWIGDKTADHVSNGGSFTNGAALKRINVIDGLLKRLDSEVPAENKVTIPENAEATKNAQLTLADDRALKVFREMYNKITPEMWTDFEENGGFSDLMYRVSPELVRNWENFMEDKALATSLLTKAEDGVTKHSYRGIPIKAKHDVSVNLKKWKDNGTKWDRPLFAILGAKDNMPIAFGEKEAFKKLKIWFDNKEEKVYFRCSFDIGAMIIEEDKVIYAR
ncbi:MAG: hypothetical protein N4A45_10315 [Flavobacteriales bacterium]|jgi:hypothetical protein|nr:hypothetical protein [Flavobacteriales bacterium]